MELRDVILIKDSMGDYYLLSDNTVNPMWAFSINGKITIGEFNDLMGDQIDWVKNVIATPNMIGYFSEEENNGVFNLTQLNDDHIQQIMDNDSKCKIEVMSLNVENIEDFDPKIHNSFSPILLNNKVIIHI